MGYGEHKHTFDVFFSRLLLRSLLSGRAPLNSISNFRAGYDYRHPRRRRRCHRRRRRRRQFLELGDRAQW